LLNAGLNLPIKQIHLTWLVLWRNEDYAFQASMHWKVMNSARLGKWLFPHLPPNRRERETKTLIIALLAGLVVAGVISAIIILTNLVQR
jgi:hypothetical protein